MSRLHAAGVIIVIILASLSVLAGCTGQQYAPAAIPVQTTIPAAQAANLQPTAPDSAAISRSFAALPMGNLSDNEAMDIRYVQESEKVQRDFYQFAAAKNPSVTIFPVMSESAGLLMTVDALLLQRYDIPAPPQDVPGIFMNKNLQTLYGLLTSQAGGAPADALFTAAASEEIHISDITAALDRTTSADLKYMYNQQLAASRNNLRVINGQLLALGRSYKPQYLGAEVFNAIVGSTTEPVPFVTITPAPGAETNPVRQSAATVILTTPATPLPTPVPTTITPISTQTLSASYTAVFQPNGPAVEAAFQKIPNGSISQLEYIDVSHLEEWEKLQSDLFSVFAAEYPKAPIFADMARSSAILTNADDVILTRYNITDPESLVPGTFTNAKIQTQYTLLVGQGAAGLAEALTASAAGEDQHIASLSAAIGRTDNEDLKYMFNQELASSKNNLRLINTQLTAMGKPFTPVYMTQDSYNAIVFSDPEPVATIA